MKNRIKILSFLCLAVLFAACEQEEKNNWPRDYEGGGWVIFDGDPVFAVNVEDPSSEDAVFKTTLLNPIENQIEYDLFVSANIGGEAYGPTLLQTITEFPHQLRVTPSEVASALGVDVGGGDIINFSAEVTTADGVVYKPTPVPSFSEADGYSGGNISETLIEAPGYRDAFSFSVSYLCPFNASTSEGIYNLTANSFGAFFGDTTPTREVISGPGENQLTIVGGAYPSQGSDDLILTINPDNGTVLSVNTDGVFAPENAGGRGFPQQTYALVEGLVFSCSGKINLVLDFGGNISGNLTNFRLVKQ